MDSGQPIIGRKVDNMTQLNTPRLIFSWVLVLAMVLSGGRLAKAVEAPSVEELQRVVKALLGYGARMPKELMLFVKNMVFLDGAIARLAPDLDLFAEVAHVATYFATTHGARLAAEVGMDPEEYEFDPDGIKAAFGVDGTVEKMTYRELQERRETIRRRLQEKV